MASGKAGTSALITVRRSKVHGSGVFAARPIRKGTRIIEYTGERITHGEADSRYDNKDDRDNHTFLFIVDRKTVIDAGVYGNDARFINHSCDPNCESVIEERRVFIEAIRNIAPGEELAYDYQIKRDADDPVDIDEIFACRCGSAACRGTMLWPAKRAPRRGRRALRADVASSNRPRTASAER
jgi:SET domain-containing protein